MKIITKENVSELFDRKSKYIELNELSVSNIVINPDTLNGIEEIHEIGHCRFDNVTFENIKMNSTICQNVDFNMVTFKNCVFDNLPYFVRCTLSDTKFEHCTLDGITFSLCHFIRSSFEHSTFSTTTYSAIRFSYIIFYKTHPKDKIPEAFLNHCCVSRPTTLVIQNCHVSGCTINDVSLVSNEEDLKLISLKGVTHVGDMNNPEILTIGPIGSRGDYTTYVPCIDWVQCGCWAEDNLPNNIRIGGSLQAFEARVKEEYGNNDNCSKSDRSIYFEEYMSAIKIFKLARKKYLDKFQIEQ